MTPSIRHVAIAATSLLLAGATHMLAGAPACDSTYPSGSFTGTATSKQAGRLQATLNLACANGQYGGTLVTSAGTFQVTRAIFDGTTLRLTFSANGASGTFVGTASGPSISGTFALGTDTGSVALLRTAVAIPPSIATLRLSAGQWHVDLTSFAQQLTVLHGNAFHTIRRGYFDGEVARLDRELPRMNGDAVYFGLDRIANSIGDAHTYVELPADDANLPLDVERFGADYRVVDAAAGNAAAVGSRVLAIDGVAVQTARTMLLPITPAAETMLLRDSRVEGFMTTGMLLHGAGISRARTRVIYTLRADDGETFADTIVAVAPGAAVRYVWAWRSRPLWRDNPSSGFWFAYLPAANTVYCRFRDYVGLDGHALALLQFVREKQPAKLVVDMRANGGGDYREGLDDLVLPIRALSRINRKGQLFVLIDQNTFSAAMADAALFRRYTHAMLVGQIIGERPNGYQEPREFLLPNSGLRVRYSTKYYAFVTSGKNEIVPDKIIVPTWREFKAGHDPVLAWVMEQHNE
jgi:hypothetical protein